MAGRLSFLIRKFWLVVPAVVALAIAAPNLAWATTCTGMMEVCAGYDLFQTVPSATMFDGLNFQGVPLGTYNFGGTIGTQNVGLTDTIIQRTSDVDFSKAVAGTTNLNVLALSLQSTTQTTIGGETGYLDVTVDQTAEQAWESASSSNNLMTINSNGTFATSSFDVFIDITINGVNENSSCDSGSAEAGTCQINLSSSGNSWSDMAPSGAEEIMGVNYELDGTNINGDFWPVGTLHNGPHGVIDAPVPAPPIGHGLLVLVAAGGVLFGGKLLENLKKRQLHAA